MSAAEGIVASTRLASTGRCRTIEVVDRLPLAIRAQRSSTDERGDHAPLGETGPSSPLDEYDRRVRTGQVQNDEHQRSPYRATPDRSIAPPANPVTLGVVRSLQHLHDELREFFPPPIVHPVIGSPEPRSHTFFHFFGRAMRRRGSLHVAEHLPRGLYLHGGVGSGKTMLMEIFFDTVPANVPRKVRLHFLHFMQDVHRRMHRTRMQHGLGIDALPSVAADLAELASVMCLDEFQLLELLMAHGVVLVTTSNRHPDDLYQNGIQRDSFLPCIALLKTRLRVINLDSDTDYRKLPRPASGVYHHPLDRAARSHAENWFRFFGDFEGDRPHPAQHHVWGRDIHVPRASGAAAMFSFDELIGRATGAADYLELMRYYSAFIVTDVPGMTYRERDLARRFITFVDAVYESRAKLVLTTAVPLTQLFLSKDEMRKTVEADRQTRPVATAEGADVDDVMRSMMDDLGMKLDLIRKSNIFTGEEERFAFARALSRLSEMGSQEWVERGMGLERDGGKAEKDSWQRVRSRWREDLL
ncbi:MAG: hypothetical protein M1826_006003 [Phylliscum demangeonii]|nr:MAG: hypothetical protein M1826_006003 [Phylliscum demangeonii]